MASKRFGLSCLIFENQQLVNENEIPIRNESSCCGTVHGIRRQCVGAIK
jgi:hypothetical protein